MNTFVLGRDPPQVFGRVREGEGEDEKKVFT